MADDLPVFGLVHPITSADPLCNPLWDNEEGSESWRRLMFSGLSYRMQDEGIDRSLRLWRLFAFRLLRA